MRYPRRRRPAASTDVQEGLFEVAAQPQRRYYRQIMEALARGDFGADALRAERIMSRLLGRVWANQGASRDGSVEESFGLGMVDFCRTYRSPVTVSALRVLAVVAPIREVREAAGAAAGDLVADGLPGPRWTPPVGAVTSGRCWSYEDVYGDQATVICEFGYGPDLRTAPRHAIVVNVDYAVFGAAASADLSHDVDALIRDLSNEAKTCAPMFVLRQVEPGWARALLGRAFARTDLVDEIGTGAGLADVRAVVLARLDALPSSVGSLPPAPPPPTANLRQALVDEFRASEYAGISGADPAVGDEFDRIVVDIVEFSCWRDPDQPTRVSPTKWDIFLHDWLPDRERRQGPVRPAALAQVAAAWSRWAAQRENLPGAARDELLRSLAESLTLRCGT